MEAKKKAYDKISNYKNDNVVQAISIKMADSTRRDTDFNKTMSFSKLLYLGVYKYHIEIIMVK